MKKIILPLFALLFIYFLASRCDSKTHAGQKAAERSAASKYTADSATNVISEETFAVQGYMTNAQRNEFVLISSSGVYTQIIRNGVGEKIRNGETIDVLRRFKECSLITDSLQLSNDMLFYSAVVDKMKVYNTGGTFMAPFVKGESVMPSASNTTEVPTGWLVPFSYIYMGRPIKEGDEIAKVWLIVPHVSGYNYARQSVYPYLCDITYQRDRQEKPVNSLI